MTQSLPDMTQLDRYLAGETSPRDTLHVETWMRGRPERLAFVEAVRSAADGVPLERAPDTERWLGTFQTTMQNRPVLALHSNAGRRLSSRTWAIRTTVVAAVVCLIAFGIQAGSRIGTREHVSRDPATVYTTRNGQIARIVLPEGSSVTLAPNSRMRLAEAFGQASRDVVLDGEAVFTVARVSGTPFVVHAGGTATRVLGTTFNVRKYPADSVVRVVVAEGRVGVGANAVVGAGDVAIARAGVAPVIQRGADIGRYFSWTDGRLTFRDVPVVFAIADLSRWYSLDIRAEGPALGRELLTLSLDNASEQEMLNALAVGLDARVTREGRRVTLSPR